MSLDLIVDFVVAIAIGGLVGLEREIYQQKNTRSFAGIRTFLVVAILGSIASYLFQHGNWPALIYVIGGGLILLLVSSYTISAVKGYVGLTTELSVLLVFVLSAVAMIEKYQVIAVVFAVLLAVILSFKNLLHNFAKNTKQVEWDDTLKFIFMVAVILPLLPNKDFTVFGVAGAFNPFRTWLMVLFVSGISFVGYFLTKVTGGAHGVGLTGFLGGLVSSTAVTESMGADSKRNPKLTNAYAFGAVAASVVMGLVVLLEVWAVDFSLLSMSATPILAIPLVGVVLLLGKIKFAEQKGISSAVNMSSPLSIKPALTFGLIYSFVIFISRALITTATSQYSFAMMGIISGFAEVHAVTLSMATLHQHGIISSSLAWTAIISAVFSNMLVKIILARLFGTWSYFKRVGLGLGIMTIAGCVMLVVLQLIK